MAVDALVVDTKFVVNTNYLVDNSFAVDMNLVVDANFVVHANFGSIRRCKMLFKSQLSQRQHQNRTMIEHGKLYAILSFCII